MRKLSIRALACACVLAGSMSAAAQDALPSAEEIQQKTNEVMTWYRGLPAEERNMETLQARMAEVFAETDFSQFGIEQIRAVPVRYLSPELSAKIAARVDELKARNDAQGAAAWAMSLQTARSQGPEAFNEAFSTTVNHPGLGQALAQGWAGEVFGAVSMIPEESRAILQDDVVALADQFDAEIPPTVMSSAISYLTALIEYGDAIDHHVVEDIRETLAARVAAAAESAEEENLKEYLAKSASFFDGAYARGELVGYEAPEVHITWFSGEETPASLADFKGKVVVVDFWATWCGPCVASFPNIRELQERYNGYDVAIIGITSLQGRHFPELGQPPIDCAGDPQKEYDLMREYLGQKEITWLVAFTEEDVFNPDFGVRGIPHMAIIDAEGKVRYRGMHPAGSTLAEKAEKIDGLLSEMGLPAPPPLSTETPGGAEDGG